MARRIDINVAPAISETGRPVKVNVEIPRDEDLKLVIASAPTGAVLRFAVATTPGGESIYTCRGTGGIINVIARDIARNGLVKEGQLYHYSISVADTENNEETLGAANLFLSAGSFLQSPSIRPDIEFFAEGLIFGSFLPIVHLTLAEYVALPSKESFRPYLIVDPLAETDYLIDGNYRVVAVFVGSVQRYPADGIELPPAPVVIVPGTAPDVSGIGDIFEGETFAEILARVDPGTAAPSGSGEDEILYPIDITLTLLSTGTDPVAAGDVLTGVVPTYTSPGLDDLVGRAVPFSITVKAPIVPTITTTNFPEQYPLTEGEALGETAFYAAITNPTNYASNVGSFISLDSITISGVVTDTTTPMTAGSLSVSLVAYDEVGTTRLFDYQESVDVEPIGTITITTEPTLSVIEEGAALSTAITIGSATYNDSAVVPTITYTLDNVSATGATIVGGNQAMRATLTYSATGATTITRTLGPVLSKAKTVAQTGTQATSVAFDGAVASFASARTVGIYADGSPWVSSVGGPVSITSITPQSSANADRPKSGGGTTGPSVVHGAMVNAGKAPDSTLPLAQRQAANDGTTNGQKSQSYDSFTATNNLVYAAAGNVDPGATGQPLVLTEGTVMKAVSTMSGVNGTARPPLDRMVPFTVVTTPPVVGAFRPGHSSSSKASWVNVSDIDMSKIPNIAAGSLVIPNHATELARIRFMSWQHTYNANSRNVLSVAGGAPVYGGDRDLFMHAILALCYNTWTGAQKLQIVRAFVQMAIDITARVEQGGIFQENGGHQTGQKVIVALAAHVTGNQRFISALNLTTTLFSWQGGNVSVWGEDRQIFRITQADVNRRQQYQYNYPASMLGAAEWSSDATRDNPDLANNFRERLNTLGVKTKGVHVGVDLRQHYRHIVAGVGVPGALALRLMGAAYLMSQKWLDYQDRHMTAHFAHGGTLPDAENNPIDPFPIAAWQRDRAGAGTGAPGSNTGGSTGDPTPPETGGGTDPTPTTPPTTVDHRLSTLAPGAPAIVVMRSQSLGVRQTEHGGGFDNHPTDLKAENFTYYQANKADAAVEAVRKTVLTQSNTRSGINSAIVHVASALAKAAPGRQFVLGEMAEQGTGRKEDADDGDDATRRRWSSNLAIYNALLADFPQGATRMSEGWWRNDFDDFPEFLEIFAPYYFGQYANGSAFPLGTIHTVTKATGGVTSYRVDHCIYDFETSDPSIKGRGLFPRTVRFDMLRKGPWSIDRTERWAGLQRFWDDPRTQSLGGIYGPPATNWLSDGHPKTEDRDGQVEAGYQYFMAPFLRAAGLPASESYFSSLTVAPNGAYADVHFVPVNGGVLSTNKRVRGTATTTGTYTQEIYGFEISRAAGGGRFLFTRPGTTTADARYQATVSRLNDTTVRITPVQPIQTGDKITYGWGSNLWYSGAPSVDDDDLGTRYKMSMPIEHVPAYTDFSMPYPFAGFQARTYSEEFTAQRGATTGSGAGSANTGGGGTPVEGAPTKSANPSISGTPQQGQTLTVTQGSYAPSNATVSRVWQVNGVNTSSTGLTYIVPALTSGDSIRCVETASNASGSVTGTSNTLTFVVTSGGAGFSTVRAQGTSIGSNATAISITPSSAPTAGNLLFLVGGPDKAITNIAGPAGWTQIWNISGNGNSSSAWYKVSNGTETGALTVTWSSSNLASLVLVEVAGPFATLDVPAVTKEVGGTSTTVSLTAGPTATPTVNTVYALAAFTADSSFPMGTPSYTDGFTEILNHAGLPETNDNAPGIFVARKVVTNGTAQSVTISHNGTGDQATLGLALFRPA